MKTNPRITVLAAALVIAATGTASARAAHPLDDGAPVGTTGSPLDSPVTVTVVVVGTGSVSGSNFACPQKCSLSFKKTDRVSLVAAAPHGFHFSKWVGACGVAPTNLSCSFAADDVSRVTAVFVAAPTFSPNAAAIQAVVPASVKVLSAVPGVGVHGNQSLRKIDVQFDVSAPSVVRYELRQNGGLLRSWQSSSPFSGRTTRTIWIDNQLAAGTYEIRLRVTTGAQVKSFHGYVNVPAAQQ